MESQKNTDSQSRGLGSQFPLPVLREKVRVKVFCRKRENAPSPQPSPGVPGEGEKADTADSNYLTLNSGVACEAAKRNHSIYTNSLEQRSIWHTSTSATSALFPPYIFSCWSMKPSMRDFSSPVGRRHNVSR
jgi:hypothetical protein